ncbi:MAG: hypothetical protein GXO90_11765, partial [FCB group bacterium]|nr:hypothetical protein [FCB group bacterium]
MKRFRRILLIIVSLLFLGAIFLLQGSLWTRTLESLINKKILNQTGWTLKLDSLSGYALTTLSFEKMELSDNSGRHLKIRQGRFRLDFAELIQRKPGLKLLDLDGIEIIAPATSKGQSEDKTDSRINVFPLTINDLRLQGKFAFNTGEKLQNVHFVLSGKYQANNERGKLKIDTLNLKSFLWKDTLTVFNSVLTTRSADVSFFPFNGTMGIVELSGNIHTNLRDRITEGALAFNPLDLVDLFPELGLMDSSLTRLDGSIVFKMKPSVFTGSFQLNPTDNQPVRGRLVVKNRDQSWILDSLDIRRNASRIQITGAYDSLKQFNGLVELRPLHLNDWVNVPFNNALDGTLILSGQVLQDSSMVLSVSFDINETEALETPTLIAGTVNFRNREIRLAEPLLINQAGGRIQITGSYQVDTGNLIGNFQAKGLDLKPFRNLTGGARGVLSGSGSWEGIWPHPSISSDLALLNGRYKNFQVESIVVSGQLAMDSSGATGNIHLKSDNLQWQNQTADHATGDFHLTGDELSFDNIHISRDKDYIQLSGTINRDGQVAVERFQAAYAGHLMVNPKPIDFTLSSSGVRTKPFELHVDDGIIAGVVRKGKNLDLRLKITNISSELISSFIPDERLRFKGIMFGEIGLNTAPEDRKISIDMSLKNGEVAGESFDDMIIAGLFEHNILNIDEFAMTRGGRTGLQVSGIIPVKADTNQPVMIDLSVHFNQFHLRSLTQFIPNFFTINGIVTGTFDLGGSGRKTTFRYDLAIDDGTFDRLSLGQVTGTGFYADHRWTMNDYTSLKGADSLSGSGYLPIDFDITSPSFGTLIRGDSLNIQVGGKKHDLDFLSTYLTDLDSVRGEFDLELILSGSPEKIIRDGSLKISDARLYTPLLDNPIRHVNGHLTIADNLLYIQDFNGALREKSTSTKPNLTLSGEMDLTHFFRPKFNVKAKGEQIYFSSIAEDMRGNVDLDLTITGRDTITIAGTIPVNQVELTQEFVTETAGPGITNPGAVIPYYKITFPIEGELNLVNKQVDANLGGEVSLSQLGNEETNYSGELFVKDGRFYYSGGIFKDLKGYLSFDGKGFNPYLDFSAQTSIDGEVIRITLSGPLANPVMNLTSASNFSQSDILQLLTWRKRFSDQDLTSTGL